MPLYKNSKYFVEIRADEENGLRYYAVVNKDTDVEEDRSTILPEAMLHAAQFEQMLVDEIHKQYEVKDNSKAGATLYSVPGSDKPKH